MQQVDQRHLESLQRHWKRHHAFPSMAKLAAVMGLASAGSVFQAVGRLVEAGFLERVEGRIAPTRRFFSRPVLGQVRAGLPDHAFQASEPELLSADEYLVRQPDRTSFAHVRGDSMRDIGLLDGDVVAVEHNTPPKPGDVVVAVVDGAPTVKRLVLESGQYVLEAANPAFETIRPGASLEVLGVVVGSFRRMTT
ncbi:MAG: LexA family transcriptional regulator [Burkholderiaceae bacterium]|nr:LexA family transcriptional regulator [Burkholderiaceae bacterium]